MTVQSTSAGDVAQGYILPPNKTEFTSVKLQMVIGVVLIAVVCFLNYLPTLNVGLLLDDFNNVDYAYRAWHGDPADFLSNFYSSWGHLDVMKAYRPIISVSFFTDYFLFHSNYAGYHFSNIIMLTLCAIFVSLITLELTGMYGNRSRASAAIWAGLLFAADPLHVESVTWIIGRVDLLCCVFYLASVFCFMRFRLVRERSLLIWSLILFLLAMGSKEPAVTLPAVQLMVCLLPIHSQQYNAASLSQKLVRSDLKYAALFFVELLGFGIMRTMFLGSAIGGYGNTDLATILNSWRNFTDKASIYKIFVPMNEELKFPSHRFDIGITKFDFGLAQVCCAGFGLKHRLVSRISIDELCR